MLKSIISIIIALIIGASSVQSPNLNKKDNISSEADYSIQGVSSIGDIINTAVENNNTDDNSYSDYYISEIVENDNDTLSVNAYSKNDSVLTVGIYDEKSDSLITQKNMSLNSGDNSVQVDFDNTLPEYYVVKAGIEDNNGNPLCEATIDTDETEWYEEFEETTVEDFSDQYVINLDINDDTNFIVFNEDVKVIEETELKEETEGFCVFDVSEETTDLSQGDIFVYNPGSLDGIVVNKIVRTNEKNNQKTVYVEEVTLEEAFSFVKIHVENDETELHPTGENRFSTKRIDKKDYSTSGTLNPGSKSKNIGPISLNVSMTVPYSFTLNYNMWNRYLYVSARVSPQATLTATVSRRFGGNL